MYLAPEDGDRAPIRECLGIEPSKYEGEGQAIISAAGNDHIAWLSRRQNAGPAS